MSAQHNSRVEISFNVHISASLSHSFDLFLSSIVRFWDCSFDRFMNFSRTFFHVVFALRGEHRMFSKSTKDSRYPHIFFFRFSVYTFMLSIFPHFVDSPHNRWWTSAHNIFSSPVQNNQLVEFATIYQKNNSPLNLDGGRLIFGFSEEIWSYLLLDN